MTYFIIALLAFLLVLILMNLGVYVKAKSNHLDLGLFDILFMRLRRVDPTLVVDYSVVLRCTGARVSHVELQNHLMCGGSVVAVVEALVAATKSQIEVDFVDLCKIDLAGRDVVGAVSSFVHPRVLSCPDRRLSSHKDGRIVAVAQDGIRLGVSVKVTVKSDINKLIGSAGELTLMARVQECILSAVGSVACHKEVLNSPGILMNSIMAANVVAGTSFILVSADVAEVVVLDNLKAKLDAVQSDADRQVAEARASAKNAEAKAAQQEMKARLVQMRAGVLLSKSRVPAAMSDSMGEGSVGSPRSSIKNPFDWRFDGL